MINKLSNDYIKKALNFYNINDSDYENKCISCINNIKSNNLIEEKFLEIYNVLYNDKENKISKLWNCREMNDLFGKYNCIFITNMLLLLGFEKHSANMTKFNLDNEQILIHKNRVRECLTNDIYNRHYDSIRISQMLWGAYFINLRLIEVGRLQYEYCKDCIKIHIPKDGKLDYYEVLNSIKNSKKLIEKYYNAKGLDYYCESWLLSKNIRKMLDQNSNILKFQSLFKIEEGESCIKDILNFVYELNECSDYNLLLENTSLQKRIKDYLLQGNDIKSGRGKVKNIMNEKGYKR